MRLVEAASKERSNQVVPFDVPPEVPTVEWPCPLCDEDGGDLIKHERVFGIVKCRKCSLMRTNPRGDFVDTAYHGDVQSFADEYRLVRSGARPHHRDRNYHHDIDLLARLQPVGRFLDVGCHTGSFLRLARNRGWQLMGVEPSQELAQLARDWWGLDVRVGFLEHVELPKAHFDVITLTDVLEHVTNPVALLAHARTLLRPGGILFVKVPNGNFSVLKYRARKLLGRGDANDFDAAQHLCHFTEETLRGILQKSGFTIDQMFVELPVQIPVWKKWVGQYYQHASPAWLSPMSSSMREALYRAGQLERAVLGRTGRLAGNIGIIARPAQLHPS